VAVFCSLLLWQFPLRAPAAELTIGHYEATPIVVMPATLFHTLVSDFFVQPDATMYVHTGDIPAMWLRDASAQTLPYVRFARTRPQLRSWVRAVIERNARNVLVDPYANAFSANYRVWEEKWEVDSLAYPVLLAWTYQAETGDRRIFTESLHGALALTVRTYECERRHAACSHYRHRELPGYGSGVRSTANGMIWSGFRPSDDPAKYPFNIPQQMIAAVALDDLAMLALAGYGDRALAQEAASIAGALRAAIERNGRVYDFRHGWIYAYEIDGRGRHVLMDDANVPSLLSAPFFGFSRIDDPTYAQTRQFVLSRDNPYYFSGRQAQGVGSAHTPVRWVWPLAIVMRALTSANGDEVRKSIAILSRTNGQDGLIHESFDVDDYRKFTRAEFGWANAMYAELLFRSVANFRPLTLHRASTAAFELRGAIEPSALIVDPLQAALNAAVLRDELERVVPLVRVGPEDGPQD
jgi:meiotically up-regulated gene 157 (Mug157) protein